jgi:hypothetical protein
MMYQDQHDVAQHDQAIEDVLHALQTTEPPQGYEARIHNALLQANQQPKHVRFNASFQNRHPERSEAKPKDLLASLLPRMSWATACAVLLIAGIAVRTHLHHEEPRTTPSIAHTTAPVPTQVIVATKAPTVTVKPPSRRNTTTQQQAEPTQPRRVEVTLQTHEYIPEPPMPLTEQERLVIRMMRRNTAQQLAEYTPDARARQLHEDAKAYNDYFAEKPLEGQPLYVQPIYHQQISGGTE